MLTSYHVKEISDLGSSGQVPDVNVAIVARREHDARIRRVSLKHKHLVIVTLEEKSTNVGWFIL